MNSEKEPKMTKQRINVQGVGKLTVACAFAASLANCTPAVCTRSCEAIQAEVDGINADLAGQEIDLCSPEAGALHCRVAHLGLDAWDCNCDNLQEDSNRDDVEAVVDTICENAENGFYIPGFCAVDDGGDENGSNEIGDDEEGRDNGDQSTGAEGDCSAGAFMSEAGNRLFRDGTDREVIACVESSVGACYTVAFGDRGLLVSDAYSMPSSHHFVHSVFNDEGCNAQFDPFSTTAFEYLRFVCGGDPRCGPYCESQEDCVANNENPEEPPPLESSSLCSTWGIPEDITSELMSLAGQQIDGGADSSQATPIVQDRCEELHGNDGAQITQCAACASWVAIAAYLDSFTVP